MCWVLFSAMFFNCLFYLMTSNYCYLSHFSCCPSIESGAILGLNSLKHSYCWRQPPENLIDKVARGDQTWVNIHQIVRKYI